MNRAYVLAGLAAASLFSLSGCERDKVPVETGEPIPDCLDEDGDGVRDCDGDCADGDPDVHPGAVEICDGQDNNCDDFVDDADSGLDMSTTYSWYSDQDGDGWGTDDSVVRACDPPYENSVLDGGDCDDDDADVNPGELELCNGIDDDCDGQVDINAVDGEGYYPDADGDAYGADDGLVTLCDETPGYVSVGGDCDETDDQVNPGATETCFNDIDDDCDGEADDACPVEICGDITEDTTWDEPSGYYVSCDISVLAELTIEPGTHVYFASGTQMDVGVEGAGALIVDAADDKVRFESGVPLLVPEHLAEQGEWTGLIFGEQTDPYATMLDGLEVYHAGDEDADGAVVLDNVALAFSHGAVCMSGGDGLVALNGAQPTVMDSTLCENVGHGFYADDTSGPGDLSDNELWGNQDTPISVLFRYGGALDSSNTLTDHSSEDMYVELRADTVEEDVTLAALTYPFQVSGDVDIYGDDAPVLEIGDGVTLAFAYGAGLSIGSRSSVGDLRVAGESLRVTMSALDPARGWDGLRIRQGATAVDITGLDLSDGGGNGYGGVYFEGVADTLDATLDDCEITGSSTHGVYIGAGVTPRIQRSIIADNTDYGVYIYDGGSSEGGLYVDDEPSFVENTLERNATPMQVPAAFVDQLGEGIYSSGTDDGDRVEITASTVVRTGTWRKLDVDYEVMGAVLVEGSAAPILSIEADTTFYVHDGAGLEVGAYADGGLKTSSPVTFTSASLSPEPGDWDGITFSRYTLSSSTLAGLVVQYAGGGGSGGVIVDLAEPSFEGGRFEYSSGHGVYVTGSATSTPEPSFTGCSFADNEGDGLYVGTSAGLGSFSENEFSGNGEHPISVNVDYAGELDDDSTYSVSGEERVHILGDKLHDDSTWSALDAPWLIDDGLEISADLEIQPGATLLFGSGAALVVGSASTASLRAEGTSAARITFTSDRSVPESGDWEGITLKSRCDASALAYVDVLYGATNLSVDCASELELTNATFMYGETADLTCTTRVRSTDAWSWSTLRYDVETGCSD